MSDSSRRPISVLCRDLMFTGKLRGLLRDQPVEASYLRSVERLPESAGDLLIVDLNESANLEPVLAWLGARPGAVALGFAAHVDTQTLAAGRAAGIRVWTNGAFFGKPDLWLRELVASDPT